MSLITCALPRWPLSRCIAYSSVLVGHMPPRFETAAWQPIFDAIRAKHPHTPILIFGGHNHIRDCVQYDDHSIA